MLKIEDVKNYDVKDKFVSFQQLKLMTGKSRFMLERHIDSDLLLNDRFKITTVDKANTNIEKSLLKEWDVVTERFRKYAEKRNKQKQNGLY